MLESEPELRVSRVASELGVARSTAHRILSTLTWQSFLTQDPVTRVYRPGTALIELGLRSVSEYDLRQIALPWLELLAQEIGETVNLQILVGGDAKFIVGVTSDPDARTYVATGVVTPAYATSGGKVLLAMLPPDQLRRLYPRGLRRITRHTQQTLATLREELELVRAYGHAVSNEEAVPGIRAVAVPVQDRLGHTIAALSVTTRTPRLGRTKVVRLVRAMNMTCTQIRNELT
jgi:DNA-binding IclR family transcriptional regulator